MKSTVYACYANDNETRMQSSSGGVYPLVARKVLQQGGTVYAACYDSDLNVVHERITDEEGLKKSLGSKYVCSTLGDTFRKIREDLKNGSQVFFVGTPCQCEGLRSYLKATGAERSDPKPADAEKIDPGTAGTGTGGLIVMDFVCHGIPGRVPWREYRNSLLKEGFDLREVNMRDKKTGWTRAEYAWKLLDKQGNSRYIGQKQVPYMRGMIKNLYCRPVCYECPFKGVERNTDLTVGDYWGVWNLQPEMDDNKGTSLLMIHTEKGREIWDSIKEKATYKEADVSGAVDANVCIVRSCSRNPDREVFFKRIREGEDFSAVVKDLTRESAWSSLKDKAKRKMRSVIGGRK